MIASGSNCFPKPANSSSVMLELVSRICAVPYAADRRHKAEDNVESILGTHIPCAPRFIAAIPVRQTSIRPSGFMIATNWSIFDDLPVISRMK